MHTFKAFQLVRINLVLLMLLLIVYPGRVTAETKIIIAYGDSLTEGCGNMVSSCGVTPRPGDDTYDYEMQLQSLLINDLYEYEYKVNNFGQGGETTADALSHPYRFEAALENSCNDDAEFILILEGTNDLLHHLSKYDVQFNLGVMIDKSIAKGLIPLVATIPPDNTPGYEYKNIGQLNYLIRQLVEEKILEGKNVVLVEQYYELEPYWDSYTDPRSCYAVFNPNDQLHPNQNGFSAMGEVWFNSLDGFLPKKKNFSWLNLLLSNN